MKSIKRLFFLLPLLGFFFSTTSFAHDTDLYMASGEGVEPNILIIFDNSGSMNDQVIIIQRLPTTHWWCRWETEIRSTIEGAEEGGAYLQIPSLMSLVLPPGRL